MAPILYVLLVPTKRLPPIKCVDDTFRLPVIFTLDWKVDEALECILPEKVARPDAKTEDDAFKLPETLRLDAIDEDAFEI